MKITEEVRAYAAERDLDEASALETGLREKGEEFARRGGELYASEAEI
jgi:phosphomethylpyrimidine synthase